MKKVLFISALCLLITTGCGGKKLTCTKTTDEGKEKMVIAFKDKLAQSAEMSMEGKEEFPEETCNLAKSIYGESLKCEGKTLKFTIKDIKNSDFYTPNEDDAELTYDYIKKDLEEEGYSCK